MKLLPLGKTVARPEAVKLRFASIVKATQLPTPPAVFGHSSVVPDSGWGDLGNTDWGDCVWAGAAHEHMLWSRAGGITPANFSDADVLSDYSIATGFSFSSDTDNGTDMQAAASYRRKTGILDAAGQRHQIDAYMALRVGDFDEVVLATWLFGAAGIGINFPKSAAQQFEAGEPWTIVPGSPIVGGHYIPVVDRLANGNLVVITWGREQEITRSFFELYNDEGIVYFSSEYADYSKLSPEGFDAVALDNFLSQLAA